MEIWVHLMRLNARVALPVYSLKFRRRKQRRIKRQRRACTVMARTSVFFNLKIQKDNGLLLCNKGNKMRKTASAGCSVTRQTATINFASCYAVTVILKYLNRSGLAISQAQTLVSCWHCGREHRNWRWIHLTHPILENLQFVLRGLNIGGICTTVRNLLNDSKEERGSQWFSSFFH